MGSLIGIIDNSSPKGLSTTFIYDHVGSFADSFSTSQIQIGESCEGSSRSSGVAHARDLGAQECYELSLKKAGQAGDRATERKAILKLGIVYSSRGDHQQAIEFYTKSIDIAKEAGDLVGVKRAQERRQKSYLDLGDIQLLWLVFIQFLFFCPIIIIANEPAERRREAGEAAAL